MIVAVIYMNGIPIGREHRTPPSSLVAPQNDFGQKKRQKRDCEMRLLFEAGVFQWSSCTLSDPLASSSPTPNFVAEASVSNVVS